MAYPITILGRPFLLIEIRRIDYVQRDPPPEVNAELEELSQRSLRSLPDGDLRDVA